MAFSLSAKALISWLLFTMSNILFSILSIVISFLYSPSMALINGLLGIRTLVPILMMGNGNGLRPSLVATLMEYGVHPSIGAMSAGTSVSFGNSSSSCNVICITPVPVVGGRSTKVPSP
jgi:hypothetical protein